MKTRRRRHSDDDHRRSGRGQIRTIAVFVTCILAAIGCGLVGCSAPPTTASHPADGASSGPACQRATVPIPPSTTLPASTTATTVATVGQAYFCVLNRWADGTTVDDRQLLTGVFAGLTQELQRRGLDHAATMPAALTGNHADDWAATREVLQRVTAALPADPHTRQAVWRSAIIGLLDSLHDDHARWFPAGSNLVPPGLGLTPSIRSVRPDATPPLFITAVAPNSPAAAADLRPGDLITTINGVAPFANGQLNAGALAWISNTEAVALHLPPSPNPVQLLVHRPSDGADHTVTLTPSAASQPTPVSASVVGGDIALIKLASFDPGAADKVFNAITDLHLGDQLRGVVLDLRGNGGGSPAEVARLLGGFVHGKVWSTDVDRNGARIDKRTDDTVALILRPLAVLTDRNCASGCDAFSDAVTDLHLGTLIGTRTAGVVAGPAHTFSLDDGSLLGIPEAHEVGAHAEIIDGIGVAPDHNIPTTAENLATGHDPALDDAMLTLHSH